MTIEVKSWSGPFTPASPYVSTVEQIEIASGDSWVARFTGSNLELHNWVDFSYVASPDIEATFVCGDYIRDLQLSRPGEHQYLVYRVRLASLSLSAVASFDIVFANSGEDSQALEFKNVIFGDSALDYKWLQLGKMGEGVTSPQASNLVVSVASPMRVEFIPDSGNEVFNVCLNGVFVEVASCMDYMPIETANFDTLFVEFRRVET